MRRLSRMNGSVVFSPLCLILGAIVATTAQAQGLEFRGSSMTGRFDNPTNDSLWRLADANGNGMIDDDESLAPTVKFPSLTSILVPELQIVETNALNGGDLATYSVVFVDANSNGQIDDGEQINTSVDFNDLHQFNIQYDSEYVHNLERWRGAQLMRTFDFGPAPSANADGDAILRVGIGARFFGVVREASVVGEGDVVRYSGRSTYDNQAAGPQAGIMWQWQSGKWAMTATGSVAAAYVYAVGDVSTQTGDGIIPGGLNVPVRDEATLAHLRSDWHDWSPLAEGEVRLSFELTPRTLVFVSGNAASLGDQPLAFDEDRWSSLDIPVADSIKVEYAVAMIGMEWIR